MMFQQDALYKAGKLIARLHKEREIEVKAFLKMNDKESLMEAQVLVEEMAALSTAGLLIVERLQEGLRGR